jgi:hypothetical protein
MRLANGRMDINYLLANQAKKSLFSKSWTWRENVPNKPWNIEQLEMKMTYSCISGWIFHMKPIFKGNVDGARYGTWMGGSRTAQRCYDHNLKALLLHVFEESSGVNGLNNDKPLRYSSKQI